MADFTVDSNEVIVGVDTWSGDMKNLMRDSLGLSDENIIEESINSIEYEVSDSNTFSRIYSKIARNTNFSYIDNESSYDDTSATLVFESEGGGKVTLFGNFENEDYSFKVERR